MAAREAERSITEIRLYKKQAETAEAEVKRCRLEVQEVKEHSLKVESERGKGHDIVADRFQNQLKEIEDRHRDELSSC